MNGIRPKLDRAANLLARSAGNGGIYAGAGSRYENQFWTRDFALALSPAISALQRLGYSDGYGYLFDARYDHLENLLRRQGISGAIPILFADDLQELVVKKIGRCEYKNGILDTKKTFVLKRIFDGMLGNSQEFPEFTNWPDDNERGLYRLTPGTTDSELLFTRIALTNWSGELFVGSKKLNGIVKAIYYLERLYVRDGLHHGGDWRDTMEVFFKDRPLLSNNSVLYGVYIALGEYKKAKALKNAIARVLYKDGTYLDYPDATRFDPFGASLAVLHGVASPDQYPAILEGFRLVDSECGVTIQCKHNPYQPGEAETIERTDGVVVWPFVVGYTILACLHMEKYSKVGGRRLAMDQFEKLHAQDGFAEYYDPADGSKWGEYAQGWSAALYVMAVEALHRTGIMN